ncbi:MAG: hemolysin family protein [Candidatus Limnocylindria bacterium]
MDLGAGLPALVLTLLLLVVNGFFVAAEYALVRVRRTQLESLAAEGSRRARLAHRMLGHIDRYISTVQVGVTGASLGLGLVGAPAVGRLVDALFASVAPPAAVLDVLSFLVSFSIVTYVTLVVAELAPKYVAIQRTLPLALWTAYPLHFAYRLLSPFVWLVNRGARGLVRPFGISPTGEMDVHSEEELKMLLAVSSRKGVLQESERVLLVRALDFADTLIRQVMVPRTEIVGIDEGATLRELRTLARERTFTRFPVFRDHLDQVVGIVHIKDLVPAPDLSRPVGEVMRKPLFMPETMGLDRALAEFRRERVQMAIVVDEFGGTSGLVTLEDVFEQLVGEVQDEFDRETPAFRPEKDGVWLVDGLGSLAELRERLGLGLEGEPYDTVGGLVFGRLGRLPKVGDAVPVEGRLFVVTALDGRRVSQVRVEHGPQKRRA